MQPVRLRLLAVIMLLQGNSAPKEVGTIATSPESLPKKLVLVRVVGTRSAFKEVGARCKLQAPFDLLPSEQPSQRCRKLGRAVR